MQQAADYTLLGQSVKTSPPALPIKQRRSKSSSSSIPDLELNVGHLHPSGPQTPLTPFTEVFTPTDCNALHCPIHHPYEHHQIRFFSDQTPPIPKKSLRRTSSLPADALNPLHLAPSKTHNYENPLYAITPSQDQLILQEELHEDLSPQQVTFDTPDEQLFRLFRSFQSSEEVSTGIQERYLQVLRNMLQNIRTRIFLNEQETEMVKTSQPRDFLLCGEQWTQRDVFYPVFCPKVPRRLFAAKVQRGDSESQCSASVLHVNIEQGVVHFPQCTAVNHTAQTVPDPPHEGSTEEHQQPTAVILLEKGLGVTVVRDVPLGTLEDFVEEGHTLHRAHPEVYERRLCLLVLQLALGLQHLGHNAVYRVLKPQSFMLVWPSVTQKVADTGEHLSGMKNGRDVNNPEQIIIHIDQQDDGMLKGEKCQTMWERWGTPRLVLSSSSEDEVLKGTSLENKLGDLLRYCLHFPHCGSSMRKVLRDTPYSPGLLWLVNHLTSEKPGLLLANVASVLQVLLWGPRKGFFQQNQLESFVFSNWLLLKRSLLVLKLAERGLFQDQSDLDWEDYLCIQYLCFTDPETIRSNCTHGPT